MPVETKRGQTFDFGDVIKQLIKPTSDSFPFFAREGWNGKGMWIGIMRPHEDSDMDLPYLFMCTSDHKLVPWSASQTDLLATDWVGVPL